MNTASRREFLGGAGQTLGRAALGLALVERLGFAGALSRLAHERLKFGALDPLVDLLQETPADALLPLVVQKLRGGTALGDVVGAAALANARAYGGTNYNGYHVLMAMMPSFEMAAQMPAPYTALPVLKVLHRNARFLQETGRATEDALGPLAGTSGSARLVESVRARDLPQAEQSLAALERESRAQAYEELQTVVRDDMNVHRVVLSWRAYDLQRLTGEDQAVTMLRQSVRFCIDEDGQRAGRGQGPSEIQTLLPRLMEERGLNDRERGKRALDDAALERLSETFFSADRPSAARAAAAILAEGIDPEDVGAALSLAATRLLLRDPGRTKEEPGKPVGSVHGASVGVHASDAANAWRHIARLGSARNAFASLIAAAYHTAGQSQHADIAPDDPDGEPCTKDDDRALLGEIEGRIRERDQKGACRAAARYVDHRHESAQLFALLLGFAVSEDGALHAEKYFRTVQEEHATARPAHRGLYLVALTRVMASHFGFPAPGYAEAKELLSA
jgi:hypothetical protein